MLHVLSCLFIGGAGNQLHLQVIGDQGGALYLTGTVPTLPHLTGTGTKLSTEKRWRFECQVLLVRIVLFCLSFTLLRFG